MSRAQAMGMDVVFAGRQGRPAGEGRMAFEEVLATSDIISLHCPLTDETRHMLNADSMATMKPGAMIINTARGALIDLDALEGALENGRIGGMAETMTANSAANLQWERINPLHAEICAAQCAERIIVAVRGSSPSRRFQPGVARRHLHRSFHTELCYDAPNG